MHCYAWSKSIRNYKWSSNFKERILFYAFSLYIRVYLHTHTFLRTAPSVKYKSDKGEYLFYFTLLSEINFLPNVWALSSAWCEVKVIPLKHTTATRTTLEEYTLHHCVRVRINLCRRDRAHNCSRRKVVYNIPYVSVLKWQFFCGAVIISCFYLKCFICIATGGSVMSHCFKRLEKFARYKMQTIFSAFILLFVLEPKVLFWYVGHAYSRKGWYQLARFTVPETLVTHEPGNGSTHRVHPRATSALE